MPVMIARIALALSVALVLASTTVSSAEFIQKWKTPDGSLYFGDRPPAGSTKVGEYNDSRTGAAGSREPKLGSEDGRVTEAEAFADRAIRLRRQIEKEINEAADRLVAAREGLTRLQSPDDGLNRGQSDADRNTKRNLETRESEARLRIAECKRHFESLTEEVRRHNRGELPASWSSILNCSSCP